jgi:integrase-like protein
MVWRLCSQRHRRHTGATVMVANGVSLRAVQAIGGWSNLRMVERYAHVDDAELARTVRVTHTIPKRSQNRSQRSNPLRANRTTRPAINHKLSVNYRLASPTGFEPVFSP